MNMIIKSNQIFSTWKKVFGNWKYLITAGAISIIFYSLNVLISSWKNLATFYPDFGFFKTIEFFFILWIGFKSNIIYHSFLSLIVISILFGVLISLVLYKSRFNTLTDKKFGLFGWFGIFFGVIAPGCVACGVGLASFLGIGAGFLVFLPFEGLELSILSIILLSLVILKISNDMYQCNIPLGKTKLKGGDKK